MKNIRSARFAIWLLSLLGSICYISSQCLTPNDVTCVWNHYETSPVRWNPKAEGGARFVELTKCKPPDCGTATLVTPWQNPPSADTRVTVEYKIYGTSHVYVKLYLERQDSSQPSAIFEKYGNYGDSFPTGWSTATARIPRSNAGYRLMLKGFTPYPDAYIAVMGIRLADILEQNNEIDEERNDDRRDGTNDNRDDKAFEDLEISQALEQGQYLRGSSDITKASVLPIFAFILHFLVQTHWIM